MRISVYKETGAGYLTYTKDLNLSCELYISYKGDKVVLPR
jgi:hypothetical protein